MIRHLLLAVQFLTRIPVTMDLSPSATDWGRSVLYFPAVGLILGVLLAVLHGLLAGNHPALLAALLLAVWTLATGGLHIDGLADAADAWVGGFGDRERSLEIMKDPRSGPVAVMVVVLVLLLKFAALQALLAADEGVTLALLLAPLLGRTGILLMMLTTPYVRPEGVGVAHADQLPRDQGQRLAVAILLVSLVLTGVAGVGLLIGLWVGFMGLRGLLLARLGGTTGDTLGATCELLETATLILLALLTDQP